MIRCGYRGYTSGKITADPMFRSFASECVKHDIPFGVYFMSQAINKAGDKRNTDPAITAFINGDIIPSAEGKTAYLGRNSLRFFFLGHPCFLVLYTG